MLPAVQSLRRAGWERACGENAELGLSAPRGLVRRGGEGVGSDCVEGEVVVSLGGDEDAPTVSRGRGGGG